jgi:hypothetical protein
MAQKTYDSEQDRQPGQDPFSPDTVRQAFMYEQVVQ